ncbi:MAG: membrane protein insertase YidC [Thermodesulfobacteriota bacterium]|nr:membrane protein insertase YidC [Thermodesulfobacteriota bacterium]
METQRVLLAIVISMAILMTYQFLVVPQQPEKILQENIAEQIDPLVESPMGAESIEPAQSQLYSTAPAVTTGLPTSAENRETPIEPVRLGRDIPVDTSLYSAIVSETGGGFKSFKLKQYKESMDIDAGDKELVATNETAWQLPLYFFWGVDPSKARVPVLTADKESVSVTGESGKEILSMTSRLSSGVEITRSLVFSNQDYLVQLEIDIFNNSPQQVHGTPYLSMTNKPFSPDAANRFLFNGPAVFSDNHLEEIKVKDLSDGPKTLKGNFKWVAYEDTYFMCGIIPQSDSSNAADANTIRFSVSDEDRVATLLSGDLELIPPHGHKKYHYTIYFGPKKLDTLKAMGYDLDKIVNYGWFDIIAKPALSLLNLLYRFVHNYGLAIVLVTIIFKLLLWPISQKGMKSMKTMQKIKPKMTKLQEKYKNDKERLNQEMIKMYRTYKVNPIGGCLPMLVQIPLFFALYKVLLQSIELRHAPFMLWITDLSAPDRLYLGFDIPYLGGLPVLTLLMGGSMFLQQKMTPAPLDPTQAKVMLFMPVLFTFMFINFSSGLVLYWFVNNLLSIAQQYLINRSPD